MKALLKLIIILISILIFTSVVSAQPYMQKGMMNNPCNTGMCAPWLNITPEQEKQISELYNAFSEKTVAVQKKIYKKQLQLKTILLEDKINAEKALNLQKSISELTAKIDIQALKSMLKTYSVLTAEQRAQLPPGCSLGFGMMNYSQRPCMSGSPMGPGRNKRMGRGQGMYR